MTSKKNKYSKYLKPVWIQLLILSYLLLSYYYFGGWWNSSAGTILIIGFSFLIWGKRFYKIIGLNINLKILLKSLLIALITIIGALILMRIIANRNNYEIHYSHWENYYHDIFYILNEEIVVGAIILYLMIKRLKIRPLLSSIILALAFSLIHFCFYKWIFNDRGTIKLIALSTLFLIGFVRNNFIIKTGHIGYSWALHFGWMAVMFGSSHVNTVDANIHLSEPERFNIYLGSTEMLIISLVLAIISFIYLQKSTVPNTA